MSRPRRVPPTPDQAIGFTQRRWFQRLQALEDAIAYRRARVTVSCPDCGTAPLGQRCEDHARDMDLIAEYMQTHHRTAIELCAQIERHWQRQLTSPGLPAS